MKKVIIKHEAKEDQKFNLFIREGLGPIKRSKRTLRKEMLRYAE